MRNCALILLSLLALQGVGQESACFKVLYAEDAFVVGNKPSVLGELYDQDVVSSNGLLVLVHRTGKFIEIKGDTTIKIGKMNQAILQSLGMSLCDNEWPNLEMLFSQSGVRGRGAVSAGLPNIEWVISEDLIDANRHQAVALLWRPYYEAIEEYEIRIKTAFDDNIVQPWKTPLDRLVINLDSLEISNDFPYILVSIDEVNKPYSQAVEAGIKIAETSYFLPDSFEAVTAIKALEIAFYLDLNDGWMQAKPYYELAAELSDHFYYQQMLQTYLIRRR